MTTFRAFHLAVTITVVALKVQQLHSTQHLQLYSSVVLLICFRITHFESNHKISNKIPKGKGIAKPSF